ncbi:MAG TPA: dihydrolipoyl dehydrogenase [Sandaracinaceae bacterium LLY-WYZ-13_1]|nr:dihydrolipoyl dehydrogenase [Sandaracinaceae bacterium LLY-WYZ-13_1]
METKSVDVAVIGAGTAGLNARREVEKAGKSFVLIEAGPYGTTCARVGCMPSKLLIAAADQAHAMVQGPIFGVHPGEWRVDGEAVMERVREERDRFAGFVVEATERIPEAARLRGRARFVDTTVLEVDDHTRVKADAVVIATGSRPWIPPPFDGLEGRVDVNDDVFEWTDLPKSVAVAGTGIIGLELGQALHRLGVEVAFFNPLDELGPFTDPALQAASREVFGRELRLHLGVEDLAAENVDGGVRIAWTEDGRRHERTFERVLAAAGRRPNLEALDLARTGLPLDERGRPPWDPHTTQCGDAPVFMAGDVSGHRPLLHEASDEGHIAGMNAARWPKVTAEIRRTSLAIAFTHPQIAIVGAPFAELDDAYTAGGVSYADQGRARVMGVNAGLVRLYARCGTCTLVGAEMLAPGAEHMGQQIAWAVQQRLTVQDVLGMPFYHPVLEEGLRTGLRDLAKALKVRGGCRGQDLPRCPGD